MKNVASKTPNTVTILVRLGFNPRLSLDPTSLTDRDYASVGGTWGEVDRNYCAQLTVRQDDLAATIRMLESDPSVLSWDRDDEPITIEQQHHAQILAGETSVAGGVLGLDTADIEGLSRWQRAQLVVEILATLVPAGSRHLRETPEQRHVEDARDAAIALRKHYD